MPSYCVQQGLIHMVLSAAKDWDGKAWSGIVLGGYTSLIVGFKVGWLESYVV
jgi:hypothetical protein